MRGLSLGWSGIDAFALRTTWRKAAALPAPRLPGLLGRQWHLEASALKGFYLFREPSNCEDFLADPRGDPAYSILSSDLDASARRPPIQTDLGHAGATLERPIFIIAAPRSGSTLLFDLLAQAPGLWTQGGEGWGAVEGVVGLHPADRGYNSHRLTEEDASDNTIACLHTGWSFGLRDRSGRRLDDFPAELQPRPRLLDKTTENVLRVTFLARACRDASFIFLHREARQNVSSLIEAWQHGGFVKFRDLPDCPRREWCFLLPPGWRRFCGRSLEEVATAQWVAANRWALEDLESLDRSRWSSVDYNDLIANPKRVVLRLCAFAGIAADEPFMAFLDRPLKESATTISPPSSLKWRQNRQLDATRLDARVRSLSGRLRGLALLSRPPAIIPPKPIDPPRCIRFSCFLDELAPLANSSTEGLMVDPSFRYQLGNSIPLGMASIARFRGRFLQDHPILWIRAPLTDMYLPYWVRQEQALLYRAMEPGRRLPQLYESAAAALLHAAGLVARPEERAAALQIAAAAKAALSEQFAALGYCTIPSLVGKPHTSALARYYQSLVESGLWKAGDDQVAQRHGWHNESVARFVHYQLTDFVAAVVREPVRPSYTYVSAYQHGAELDPHIDRKQCVYTLSFIIDESGGRSSSWPLHFETAEGHRSVTLDVGDGVLFRGHDMPHWRELAPEQVLALSTILAHYVPAEFAETLE